MDEQTNAKTHKPKRDDENRNTQTVISLSNVLWILITVVSIASFIFTYDTRISILEEQIKDVPTVESRVDALHSKLKDVQTELQTAQLNLARVQTNYRSNSSRIDELERRVRELEYQIQTLQRKIASLEQSQKSR